MKQQDAEFLRLPVWSCVLHFICSSGVWISSFRYHFHFTNFNILKVNKRIKQVARWEASISKHVIRGQILLDELVFDVCELRLCLRWAEPSAVGPGWALQHFPGSPSVPALPHGAAQTHTVCSCCPRRDLALARYVAVIMPLTDQTT